VSIARSRFRLDFPRRFSPAAAAGARLSTGRSAGNATPGPPAPACAAGVAGQAAHLAPGRPPPVTPGLTYNSVMTGPSIETFPNPRPDREYEIRHRVLEFTSVCPKTGLPDFGRIEIVYVPAEACLELKSLKYYFLDFRNRGIFYEHAVNQILDDLVAACRPRRMTVVGRFSIRGGIRSTVTATYERPA
jgi:7-cyano-7-deazaguanine reductase